MATRKTFYPVKDVTLPGLMADVNVLLCGISDVFAHREYATLYGKLILATTEMISDAITEIKVTGGIMLDAEDVAAYSTTEMNGLTADILVSSIISSALRKVVAIEYAVACNSNLSEASNTAIDRIVSQMLFAGSVTSQSSTNSNQIDGNVVLQHNIINALQQIVVNAKDAVIQLNAVINSTIKTPALLSESYVALSCGVTVVAVRLRTIGHLDGMTIRDVQDWDLRTYYYLEV